MAADYKLRLATLADAPAIQRIYAPNVDERPASFEEVSPDVAEIERRITSTLEKYPYFVCEETSSSTTVAYAYASIHRTRTAYDWSCEISIYVDPGHARRGLGMALCTAVLGALQKLEFYIAISGITLPNDASQGLHKRLGFVVVGAYHAIGFKLGKWHDSIWYHRDLRLPLLLPTSPLSAPAFYEDAKAKLPNPLPPPSGKPRPFSSLSSEAIAECLALGTEWLR